MLNFTSNQESTTRNHNDRLSDWQTLESTTIPSTGEDAKQRGSNAAVNCCLFENNLLTPAEVNEMYT